jgi:hypothetical protein
MTFTSKERKSAYQLLRPEAQELIMSNETTESISELLKDAGLSEEQRIEADTEMLCVMLGLQSLTVGIEKISQMSEKAPSDFIFLQKYLENNILNKYEIIENVPEETGHANLPMVEPGEVAHDVPHVEQPLNAPVSSAPAAPPLSPPPEVTKAEPSKPAFVPPKSHYSSGQDPYREPLV